MPNYVVENGIDFFAELTKDNNEVIIEETCLISSLPLLNNSIKLNCGHRFNYVALYNEVKNQKRYSVNETTHLSLNEIKCPYCRRITPKLLPYLPCYPGITRITGVNSPQHHCMDHKYCKWKFKSGKNKNNFCNKPGFDSDYGECCKQHFNIYKKNDKKSNENIEWNEELEEFYKKHTVQELKAMLRKKKLKVGGIKKDLVIRLKSNK
tara:strand:- start:14423 stop:15046 length:624 start_codon:yes stop_codon:yes gene_type:complete